MPRKAKPPMALVIEGLSGSDTKQDDFTGELIPSAKPKPLSAQELRKRQQDRKKAAADRILAIAFAKPPQVELVPAGKRKIAEINGQAVLVDLPKWRRV